MFENPLQPASPAATRATQHRLHSARFGWHKLREVAAMIRSTPYIEKTFLADKKKVRYYVTVCRLSRFALNSLFAFDCCLPSTLCLPSAGVCPQLTQSEKAIMSPSGPTMHDQAKEMPARTLPEFVSEMARLLFPSQSAETRTSAAMVLGTMAEQVWTVCLSQLLFVLALN